MNVHLTADSKSQNTLPKEAKRAIPSLDGLRAFSVISVILGHTVSKGLDRIPLLGFARNGHLGVNVFFVISGFLITHLLLKEMNRAGGINLKRFYFRRSLRIFPPFYAFLLVVAICKLPDVTPQLLLCAGTYTWNYLSNGYCWVLGHTWSLAVEEQFYLLWPVLLAFCGRVRALWIAITVIAFSPFVRVASYYAFPSMRGYLSVMTHTHLDPIMAGCALALLLDMKKWMRLIHLLMRPAVVGASLLFLIVLDGLAAGRFGATYLLSVGYTLQSFAIASVLLFAVFHHQSFLGRILNFAPIRHLGIISYSLYLWQQVFTGPRSHIVPLNWVWIVLCAELSYFIIERPSLRIRGRLEKWLERWLEPRRSSHQVTTPS